MIRPDLSSLPSYIPGKVTPGALRLASNESNLAPLPSVTAAVAEAASDLNRYPDMGAVALRERIASWFATQVFPAPRINDASPSATAENALPSAALGVDNVAVGNGSSALCLQAIQATCKAGDEVIFAWRSFEAYPILARVAGAEAVAVPLIAEGPDRGKHDLAAMAAAITDRTRLIFVCNPNNPTGTTITSAEFREFMAQVPPQVQVVLDEAYAEYNRAADTVVAQVELQRYPNLAVCRTFSKAYGLAGARLGYLVGHAEFVEAVNKVAVPFGANALAQVAGLACTESAAAAELSTRVEATIEQRRRVEAYLAERLAAQAEPARPELVLHSETNFLWLEVGADSEKLFEALQAAGVMSRCFAGEGVRISITDKAETDQLLAALESALPAVGL